MKNNNQIDNTSYYTLPSGKQLEDFIHIKNLTFRNKLDNLINEAKEY